MKGSKVTAMSNRWILHGGEGSLYCNIFCNIFYDRRNPLKKHHFLPGIKYQDPCTFGVISNDASKTSSCNVFVVNFNNMKKKNQV